MRPDPIEETTRDISAAKAELLGRRDAQIADYDHKIAALEDLAAQLQAGGIEPRQAQARVRQLLGERERGNTTSRRAGRTKIGLSVPAARGATTGPISRLGPSPQLAAAGITKAIADIDSRIVSVAAAADADGESKEVARLELSLLLRLRRTLDGHVDELPSDVVLLESVIAFTEQTAQTLQDLESGGAERLGRLLDFDRSLVSELVALGAEVAAIKDSIKSARGQLAGEGADLDAAEKQAVEAFGRLQRSLEEHSPISEPSLLERLTRP